MNEPLALDCALIRVVATLREHLALADALGAMSSWVLECPSESIATKIRMDLTPAEQARVRCTVRPAPACEVCRAEPTAACARCAGPACAACDRCYGCEQLVCRACDSAGTEPFTFPGDACPHPHNPADG